MVRGAERSRRTIPAASKSSTRISPTFRRAADRREPHAETRADRPAHLQRHRQRVFRRDPARRAAVADEADVVADDDEIERLYHARGRCCRRGSPRLRDEAGDEFPEKVTAFRPDMAVHGRYGKPCPVCGAPIQRIVYARNEANYCTRCQTGGRLLSDRALSRLLRQDWPKTLEEMEQPTA